MMLMMKYDITNHTYYSHNPRSEQNYILSESLLNNSASIWHNVDITNNKKWSYFSPNPRSEQNYIP